MDFQSIVVELVRQAWRCSGHCGGGWMTWRLQESATGPTRGTVSQMARVSIARWNLKEAEGKALARNQESVARGSLLSFSGAQGRDIPKSGGGNRMLGIPTVQDRLIQQALHQVLSPVLEEPFSNHSYGSRLGRSAAQALQQARSYIEEVF